MPSGRSKGPFKGGGRRNENNRIYANPLPILFTDDSPKPIRSVLNLLGLSLTRVQTPHCDAIFDPTTCSVWVTNSPDALLLWRRGFFGKGDLSRSEPSWLARQKTMRGKQITSEEIREKRRAERKQFKLDRARAIAAVAAEAEAIFESEGRVITPALSGPNIPSAATWKPTPAATTEEPRPSLPLPSPQDVDEEELEDLEHLQLTLPEAFFLIWNFDCLTLLNPDTHEPMSLEQIWNTFQQVHFATTSIRQSFLINYVVYHYYRSLGWVVRGGLKFCVDYLLSKFSVVICPVYEDPADQDNSVLNVQKASPFAWSWLSTINRANTQVQKTLILAYVTIPARSRLSTDVLESPACFSHYSVREVVVRRFIPARMRD
ncbi:tRNA-intron endonuclease [Armillaria borealis]|uniref:tRNA-splicing endonuclease subunit Sen2 n=1 Tax=Armillaria borealis TaxID=47425 RepID=A0AA39JRS1_9AGAR|nr:tRNA-intron endonuclease [Armillaria borealis]